MTFDEDLSQVQELLQREQRVSYRGLKRRFALDDDYLEDLKEELIRNTQAPIDSYNLTGNPAQLAALRFRRTGLRRRNRSLGGRKAGRDCGWLLLSSPD
jgi:hypothetical protein